MDANHADLIERLVKIQTGGRLHVSDGDGVLVQVKTAATRARMAAENLHIFATFAASHPVATLTGRAHAWELPQMMLGDPVTPTAPDMTELLARLPVPLGDLPYMHDHGQKLTVRGVTREAPPLTGAQGTQMDHINEIGRLCRVVQTQIAGGGAAVDPRVREILASLHFTPQATLLNINIFRLPPAHKDHVVRALEELLRTAQDGAVAPAAAVRQFLARLLPQGADPYAILPNEPPFQALEKTASPLPILRDDDGTYIQLGTGTKGNNLLHWLQMQNFLRDDQDITLVADNFQSGGSDRELAEALISVYGHRVHLWQSLDGGKSAMAADDPLRSYLEFIFTDFAAGFTFLNLLNTATATEIAAMLLAKQVPGVSAA